MFQELKFQLSTAILTILTLAAGVSAFINFQQQNRFRLPEDGVIWVDRQGGVEALVRQAGSPGPECRNPSPATACWISTASRSSAPPTSPRCWPESAPGARPSTSVQSRGVELTATLIVAEQPLDRAVLYQYLVGTAYLIIGLFVYFRRGSAQKAQHFYILCLASFHLPVLPLHRQAEQLRQGDLFRQRGGRAAGAHPVPAFLPDVSRAAAVVPRRGCARCCCTCRRPCCSWPSWRSVPARMKISVPLIEVRWLLDRAWMVVVDRCPT